LLNLFDTDRSEEINKIIKEWTESNLILINYPNTKNHFNSLNQKLAQEGQKIKNIILFKFNYELISSIQKEYLICTICERIFKKEEVIKEGEKFVCPDDSKYQFPLEKINKFNEQIISHYLKNSKELIENFLQENNSSSNITQLTISKKEEIFSGEIQKNLLSIIRSI
jgi:adenylate kinase family enzyme